MIISLKLKKEHQKELFGNVDKLEMNHEALVELRNTVSHHRLLFVYEDFEECCVDDVIEDTLIHNVKNLQQLIVPYYKSFFIDAIINCIKDRRDANFLGSLPREAIISI